ncbi:hypothetical protein HMPREF9161_00103 [Selenomonas sp. F0473]|nr:hypothetical protein HMPREF9161_00103 [Selenomonas sp. F0473]
MKLIVYDTRCGYGGVRIPAYVFEEFSKKFLGRLLFYVIHEGGFL